MAEKSWSVMTIPVVNEKQLVPAQKILHIFDATGGAEQLRFVSVMKFHAPFGTVAKMVFDGFGHEVQVDGDLIKIVCFKLADDVREEWDARRVEASAWESRA